jgi:hypothetical protein
MASGMLVVFAFAMAVDRIQGSQCWGRLGVGSFIGISKAHTTNLAVVAPGISEALLATALGLAAAIPAVVIYNMFARSIAGLRLVSRDLERAAAVPVERAPSEPVAARGVRLADAGAAPRGSP